MQPGGDANRRKTFPSSQAIGKRVNEICSGNSRQQRGFVKLIVLCDPGADCVKRRDLTGQLFIERQDKDSVGTDNGSGERFVGVRLNAALMKFPGAANSSGPCSLLNGAVTCTVNPFCLAMAARFSGRTGSWLKTALANSLACLRASTNACSRINSSRILAFFSSGVFASGKISPPYRA